MGAWKVCQNLEYKMSCDSYGFHLGSLPQLHSSIQRLFYPVQGINPQFSVKVDDWFPLSQQKLSIRQKSKWRLPREVSTMLRLLQKSSPASISTITFCWADFVLVDTVRVLIFRGFWLYMEGGQGMSLIQFPAFLWSALSPKLCAQSS